MMQLSTFQLAGWSACCQTGFCVGKVGNKLKSVCWSLKSLKCSWLAPLLSAMVAAPPFPPLKKDHSQHNSPSTPIHAVREEVPHHPSFSFVRGVCCLVTYIYVRAYLLVKTSSGIEVNWFDPRYLHVHKSEMAGFQTIRQ